MSKDAFGSDGGMGSGGGKSLDIKPLPRRIDVYCHPHPLSSQDVLTDGDHSAGNKPFKFDEGSILVWIDLQPEARFAHSTAYVFFHKGESRMEKGGWWPVLNGKKILYGESEPFSINFPS